MRQPGCRRHRRSDERGSTLVEVLVVIVIVGILAAVVVLAVGGISHGGQASACRADLRIVDTAIGAFHAEADDPSVPDPTEAELVTAGFLNDVSTMHDIDASTGAVEGVGACA